ALLSRFGPQGWWPARSAFEVVVGAILAQGTAWANVERAIEALRRGRVLKPGALRRLPPRRLAALVRSSGFYRIKAGRLRAVLEHLALRHGGRPPPLPPPPPAAPPAAPLPVPRRRPE